MEEYDGRSLAGVVHPELLWSYRDLHGPTVTLTRLNLLGISTDPS